MKFEDILERLEGGERILRSVPTGPRKLATFSFAQDGETVSPEQILKLADGGFIEPLDDGLPGLGEVQSYAMKAND